MFPKSDATNAEAPRLTFSKEDEESSGETEAPDEAWSEEALKQVQSTVQAGLHNLTDKKKRLTLDQLKKLLTDLPQNTLEANGLQPALTSLNALTKLPRESGVRDLLLQIQDIVQRKIRQKEGKVTPVNTTKGQEHLFIHRVGKVSSEGHAAVKEGDPVDTVVFTKHETVEDVISRFSRHRDLVQIETTGRFTDSQILQNS